MSSARQKVMRQLKTDGWVHVRTSGSHLVFKNQNHQSVISVPMDGKATNPRVFTSILCQLRNGTKFERRDIANKGAAMETKPKPPTLSPETKKLVLETISQKAQEPRPPTLPFPVPEPPKDGAAARGKPRGRMGAVAMKFSDEDILYAATIIEEGGTLTKAARHLRCSSPTARKCLSKFFGDEAFNALLNTPPKIRRKTAKEKAKLAMSNMKPATAPAPINIPATPPTRTKFIPDDALIGLQFNIKDITDVKFEASYGEATVTLKLPVGSSTFMLFCAWTPPKK